MITSFVPDTQGQTRRTRTQTALQTAKRPQPTISFCNALINKTGDNAVDVMTGAVLQQLARYLQ
jgi:hypothetical protein